MNETEFLVTLLKMNEHISDEVKDKILERILEIEKLKKVSTTSNIIPSPLPDGIGLGPFTVPSTPGFLYLPCDHEYDQMQITSSPPHCVKCGKPACNLNVTCSTNGNSHTLHCTTGYVTVNSNKYIATIGNSVSN